MTTLGSTTSFLMISAAVIIDLIGLIPFAGTIADIVASFMFGIWFSHHGVSLMNRRPLGFLGTILGEFIPGIDMAPFWTFFVVTTIAKVRAESAV